jgi:ferric-dicitrate binding protein FerR (iron transport regulator)
VALATGIVQVQTQKAAPVQLLPGEAVRVASNGSTEVYNFNYLGQMGWKDGILVFKENTLPEIINKLESWYGVDIINTISAQEKFRYTGTNQNESLDEVLKGISFVHHFQYTIDGDTVRLYP